VFGISPVNNPTLCISASSTTTTFLTTCTLNSGSIYWMIWSNMNLYSGYWTGQCLMNAAGTANQPMVQGSCTSNSALQMTQLTAGGQLQMRGQPLICGEANMAQTLSPNMIWNNCRAPVVPQSNQQFFTFYGTTIPKLPDSLSHLGLS
jgi:hypothetical protein